MTVMTAVKKRRRGPRRLRPWPCRQCRAPILWATVRRLDGSIRKIPVNAEPVPHGNLEYVAGPILRPVLRELEAHELLMPAQGDRYISHLRYCRLGEEPEPTPIDRQARR